MNFTELGGVQWCTEHLGLVDECSDRTAPSGEPYCDQVDATSAGLCRIVPLYTINPEET